MKTEKQLKKQERNKKKRNKRNAKAYRNWRETSDKQEANKNKKKKELSLRELVAISALEAALQNSGYSGSSNNFKALVKSYNSKTGNKFTHVNEVIKHFRIKM